MLQKCRLELARLQQATTISAGIRSSVGMIRNGKVYLAGNDYYSWRSELDTWNDIISISVKGNFVVGLKEDGTVVTTLTGETAEEVEKWKDIIAISAGDSYIVGLKSNNTIVTTQAKQSLDDINKDADIVAISAGYGFTLVLKSDGSVEGIGYNHIGQINVDT